MTKTRLLSTALWALPIAVIAMQAPSVLAQEQPAAPAAPAAPADQAAAPAAPTSNAMTTPAMSASLSANANPMSFDLGSFLGKNYITGAFSGLGMWQDNVFPGDHAGRIDLSNAQLILQKTDGWLQYFVQAGVYSVPDLGAAYVPMSKVDHDLFGYLPQAFLKIAPTDTFSVEIGKLPTLIGGEYTFSYENLNIQRGLLWNQEPAVSRGIQANFTLGAVALSASWNDGLYSDKYNWITGSATWTIDPANTLAVVGGGALSRSTVSTFATPTAQNNEAIFNVLYTHTSGPWTFNPYFQYTSVSADPVLGYGSAAETYGFALLVNYAFDADGPLGGFSLPVRFEYISASGSATSANLLYGPSSSAVSITVTPTYQHNYFFARGEFSYVGASGVTPGDGLGPSFNGSGQTRVLLEAGVIF